MESKNLESYIAEHRLKQRQTQKKLTEQLHVTDKAVSRWERGDGFPDIQLMQSLADVLHVSLIELMNSDVFEESTPSISAVDSALKETICTAEQQQKEELFSCLFPVYPCFHCSDR